MQIWYNNHLEGIGMTVAEGAGHLVFQVFKPRALRPLAQLSGGS